MTNPEGKLIAEPPAYPDSGWDGDAESMRPHGQLRRRVVSVESQSIRITTYRSWTQLEERIPAWEKILSESPALSIFSTPQWLGSWWRTFGSNKHLVTFAFSNGDGELLGLAPFYLEDVRSPLFGRLKCLRLVGDGSGDSDNLDFIVNPEHENACAAALIDRLKTGSDWHLCELNNLAADSTAVNKWLQRLKSNRWNFALRERPRLTIDLPETWDGYLARLSSKERTKVRYYSRRLGRIYSVRFFKCVSTESLSYGLEALFDLHQKRWRMRSEPGTFTPAARRQFYYRVARSFLERKWLELWLLELNGKPVAAQFGFRYRDTVHSLQEGFDPDYATYKVGYVLRSHVLERLISQGVRRYDFLAGQDPSKERWGTRSEAYFDLHFGKPWSRGAAHQAMVVQAYAAKHWLRKHLPPWAWNVLHWLNVRRTSHRSVSPLSFGCAQNEQVIQRYGGAASDE
jgi:CelD/BcsL family acetyltransferase involved in cellulose biosynthesis